MNMLTIDEYNEVLFAITESIRKIDCEIEGLKNATPVSDKGHGIIKRANDTYTWKKKMLSSAWDKLCALKTELENNTPFEER